MDEIGYEAIARSAKIGMFRAALQKVVALGALPGGHHFYITFNTAMPGVEIADYLKDKFPEEMTIVIQHQYWDLEVHDDHFEIILKFGGVPQHLHIPYSSLTRFYDPSVSFGLEFEAGSNADVEVTPNSDGSAAAPKKDAPAADGAGSDEDDEATVVSLDAFRRK